MKVVGQICCSQFPLGPLDTDSGGKQTEPILPAREHMLRTGSNRRFRAIHTGNHLRHRFAFRLAAMDPACQPTISQPCLVGLRAIAHLSADLMGQRASKIFLRSLDLVIGPDLFRESTILYGLPLTISVLLLRRWPSLIWPDIGI